MSRTIPINQRCLLFILLVILVSMVNQGYAVSRHTLILVDDDTNYHLRVLELLSSGEIVTTGQSILVGPINDRAIAVSPDQQYVWTGATSGTGDWGVKQFIISSDGQLNPTSRFINCGGPSWDAKFTPNGQLLFLNGPIYRTFPNGSVESTTNWYSAEYHISPLGNINLRFDGIGASVDKIDYSGYSVYNIQYVELDSGVGAEAYDVEYTPDGKYAIIANGGGLPTEVEIYPILEDGSLDTTHIQGFDMTYGNVADLIGVSKDGRYIYVGSPYPNQIGVLRKKIAGDGFEDTGWRISLTYVPWYMLVSPDGKYLVTTDMRIFETFAIQDDGNLVATGYQFPYESIFGTANNYFQFAYPPAPTEVEYQNWQLYE